MPVVLHSTRQRVLAELHTRGLSEVSWLQYAIKDEGGGVGWGGVTLGKMWSEYPQCCTWHAHDLRFCHRSQGRNLPTVNLGQTCVWKQSIFSNRNEQKSTAHLSQAESSSLKGHAANLRRTASIHYWLEVFPCLLWYALLAFALFLERLCLIFLRAKSFIYFLTLSRSPI